MGEPVPVREGRTCSEFSMRDQCTDPQFVDSKTYRLIIAVNGQVPGPNIIVHEEQTVIINVKNNLTTEGVSIHWSAESVQSIYYALAPSSRLYLKLCTRKI